MKYTFSAGDQPVKGFTIQRGIGRGGFGEVYQAVSDGGKEVALKLVQRHLNVELRGVTQCLNLKHPNLLSLYDVRQAENGDCWVVMEYVNGGSLDQVLARNRQGLPPEEAVAWLRGICAGVGYLHERGIVHRDLKPGNIFIENGLVKIGDYGLSKFISASRRSGQTESVGTVHYMAPEVAKGRYNKELDLYALGVIFYEMLSGRVPFDGESPGEILMKHMTADADFNGVPEAFRPMIARLLEKDPQRRYLAVEALLADVGEACRAAGVEARAKPSMYVEAVQAGKPPGLETAPFQPDRPITALVAEPGPGTLVARAGGHVVRGVWNATRHYGWRDLIRQNLAVLVRLGVAGFLGAGVGLLAGGVATLFTDRYSDAPAFLGAGSGCFFGAISAYLMLRSFSQFVWWRVAVCAAMSAGVGLTTGGIAESVLPRYHSAPPFFGVGSGFLTFGLAAYLLLFRRARETQPASAAGTDTGRLSSRSTYRSSRGLRGSVEARPFLWSASVFITLVVASILMFLVILVSSGSEAHPGGMDLLMFLGGGTLVSFLVSVVFCVWAFLLRTLPAQADEGVAVAAPELQSRAP